MSTSSNNKAGEGWGPLGQAETAHDSSEVGEGGHLVVTTAHWNQAGDSGRRGLSE